jgi:phosphoribosylformylglycinamidine (FGAM) synthase PurS component
MRARVFVTLKPGILDVQGSSVKRALEGLGFPEVRELRVSMRAWRRGGSRRCACGSSRTP